MSSLFEDEDNKSSFDFVSYHCGGFRSYPCVLVRSSTKDNKLNKAGNERFKFFIKKEYYH